MSAATRSRVISDTYLQVGLQILVKIIDICFFSFRRSSSSGSLTSIHGIKHEMSTADETKSPTYRAGPPRRNPLVKPLGTSPPSRPRLPPLLLRWLPFAGAPTPDILLNRSPPGDEGPWEKPSLRGGRGATNGVSSNLMLSA
jgi:hypothetical protein